MRLIALSGFEIVSPVRCSRRRASSESEPSASGSADSSPACGEGGGWVCGGWRAEEEEGVEVEGKGVEEKDGKEGKEAVGGLRILDSAKAMLGECGSEGGSAWMASSTFLGGVSVRLGGGEDGALLELFLCDVGQRGVVHGLDERDGAHLKGRSG